MGKWKDAIRSAPYHVFFLPLYPIAALLAANVGRVSPWLALRSVLLVLALAAILLLVLTKLMGSSAKAGLVVSLLLLALLSFGRILGLVINRSFFGITIGYYRLLLLLLLAIFVFAYIPLSRTRRNLVPLTQFVNIVALTAVGLALAQIIWRSVNLSARAAQPLAGDLHQASLAAGASNLRLPQGQTPPDIYYIILDGYTREDTLANYLNFDNQSFLQDLQDLGFYVGRCSQSNYAMTQLSLASSLNFSYLDSFGVNLPTLVTDSTINQYTQKNQVREILEGLGYQTVVVESGFSPTSWHDAAVFRSLEADQPVSLLLGGINEFESILARTSIGLLVYEWRNSLPQDVQTFIDAAYTRRRMNVLFALDDLERIPALSGPKFVFVHILAAHEPFVFTAEGDMVYRKTPFTLNDDPEMLDPRSYRDHYSDQVSYINKRLIPIVSSIIAGSSTPPVIILQGDHGPSARVSSITGQMTIFNAYYLPANGQPAPESGNAALYPEISPVNTFRVIFNRYFQGQFELLEDVSYFSLASSRSEFTVVSNERPGCAGAAP